MLRLIKLNLYNYKLYKNLVEEWKKVEPNSTFLNEVLLAENYDDHDRIINYFLHEEKNKINGPSLTYFLYDTKVNGFIGAFCYYPAKKEVNYLLSVIPNSNNDYKKDIFVLSLIILRGKKYENLMILVNNADTALKEFIESSNFNDFSKTFFDNQYTKYAIKI